MQDTLAKNQAAWRREGRRLKLIRAIKLYSLSALTLVAAVVFGFWEISELLK